MKDTVTKIISGILVVILVVAVAALAIVGVLGPFALLKLCIQYLFF